MRHLAILINGTTLKANTDAVDRSFGFSDGWYDGTNESQELSTRDRGLINARAALLPVTSTVVGVRIAILDNDGRSKGRSRPYLLSVRGGFGQPCDDPRMSLKYALYGNTVTNELQYYLQNVADGLIITGSYSFTNSWEALVRTYFDYVFNQNYSFLGYNLEANQNAITSISAGGVVTIQGGNLFAFGQYARVIDTRKNARGSYRQNPNGHMVTASVDQTVTLDNWTAGACTGGRLQIWEKLLFRPFIPATQQLLPLVCTKKVGKPYFQYRGRASARI